MMKTTLTLLLCLLFGITVHAQLEKSPLFAFLQKEADSTLVITHSSAWGGPIQLKLLSKKADTISMYTYKYDRSLHIGKIKMIPKAVQNKLLSVFIDESIKIMDPYLVAPNLLFKPQNISLDSVQRCWQLMMESKIWTASNEKEIGCPHKTNTVIDFIDDGHSIVYYRITKDKIEKLDFYEPEYFENEKRCPGNPNRIAAIKAQELFNQYFKN